jgi:hypothetical protein
MIAKAVVLKSLLLLAAFCYTRTSNHLYSSPTCAMRLVNESDPGAYSRHPYWKDLEYGNSCAGEELKQYVHNQYYNTERYWMDLLVNAWTVTGVCLILCGLYRGGTSMKAVFTTIFMVIFAYFAASIVLMHTHFEIDITFLSGGIIHHARADKPGIDYKNNSVTEGYLYCGIANRLFYTFMIYWLINRDSRYKKRYNTFLGIGLLQVLVLVAVTIVGKMHPIYHEWAVNGSTPEMDNAWPYTAQWQAYKHCIVHHDNGQSFSGDLFLDPLWDAFLYGFAFLHNSVFKIKLGSAAHFAMSALGDMAMNVLGIALLSVVLRVGLFFVPSSEKEAKEKLAKKQN